MSELPGMSKLSLELSKLANTEKNKSILFKKRGRPTLKRDTGINKVQKPKVINSGTNSNLGVLYARKIIDKKHLEAGEYFLSMDRYITFQVGAPKLKKSNLEKSYLQYTKQYASFKLDNVLDTYYQIKGALKKAGDEVFSIVNQYILGPLSLQAMHYLHEQHNSVINLKRGLEIIDKFLDREVNIA